MQSGATRKCKGCSKHFTITKDWQVFCSQRCKNHWHFEIKSQCKYCGEPAASVCVECRGLMAGRDFPSFADAIQFLIGRYTAKYKLNVPDIKWSEDELEEIGRNLRRSIGRMIAQREFGEDKVSYLNWMLMDDTPNS